MLYVTIYRYKVMFHNQPRHNLLTGIRSQREREGHKKLTGYVFETPTNTDDVEVSF
jgi:hypothetical protein